MAVAPVVVSSGAEVVFADLSRVLEGVQLLLFEDAGEFDQFHLPALVRWLELQLKSSNVVGLDD